jgi:SHS2 domain-containing protein
MTYRFLEEVATADIAFEVEAPSREVLFREAALALFEVMVDLADLEERIEREVLLESPELEDLFYEWLSELIYLKDVEGLFFRRFDLEIEGGPPFRLRATLWGDEIDPTRQEVRADVKAVTYHLFAVEEREGGWYARVVLDI